MVIIYFNEFSGTITSLLDLYLELGCKGLLIIEDLNLYTRFKEYFPPIDCIMINSFLRKTYEFDIVITSVSSLKNLNFSNVKYKKLILLDSNTIASCYFLKNYDFFKMLKSISAVILANSFNQKILASFDIPSFHYLHQFSEKRLKMLDIKSINGDYYVNTNEYERKGYLNYKPHWYETLHYYRHIRLGSIYYENIGKLPFEFMYFNKPVFYSIKNKCFDDGFTEYAKKIGIDDSCNQELRNIDISNLLYNHEIEKYI